MSRSAAEHVLGLLSDGQVWSGQRLADASGLSLRTVRRALVALREEGVVIDTDVGRGGGVRLGARSTLPRIRLVHQEAVSLLFALALAESLRLPLLGAGLRPLRAKLTSMFAPAERTTIHRLRTRILIGAPASEVVRGSWRDPDGAPLQRLQEAFIASRVVEFRYLSRDGRASLRRVEPQYLLLNHPAWYLLGRDQDADAGRTFRLDGIQRLQVLEASFTQVPHDMLSPDVGDWFRPL